MNFEELKEYVGVKIAELVRDLPLYTKTPLWTAIANWRAEGVSCVLTTQYILEWINIDYNQQNAAEVRRHNEMIHEGITFMSQKADWSNLTKVAKQAIMSAICVCENQDTELSKNMLPFLEVKMSLLNAGVSEYGSVIKTLKEIMSKQAIKWINTILNNPESEDCVDWKKSAEDLIKDLIKDLMELDNYFRYDFDSKDRLYIKKTHGIYGGGIQYVEHIEVYYCDSETEDFLVTGSQYFHVTDLDEAISIFIERILSGEPRKPQGETITLEDISYKKAWQK